MQLLNVSHFHHVCSWGAYCALVFVRFIRYRTFVSEDAGPNTLVATVLAKDPDGDGITYKITTGNEEGNFVIDNQKGLITGLFVVFIRSLMLNILLTTACFQTPYLYFWKLLHDSSFKSNPYLSYTGPSCSPSVHLLSEQNGLFILPLPFLLIGCS